MHPAALDDEALLKDCEVASGRASGPGGQNRNKVETAIRITHRPSGLVAKATERRHKEQNKQQALLRLRLKLAAQVREPVDPGAAASACWQARVRQRKLMINPGHADYPLLLAEALDRLAAVGYVVPAAAELLGVSASQLLKLIKHEPDAMSRLNSQRRSVGLHPLN
ncbi:MAG: peptide chain release factor-like protein [Planctomycetota bacterium]